MTVNGGGGMRSGRTFYFLFIYRFLFLIVYVSGGIRGVVAVGLVLGCCFFVVAGGRLVS